MVIYIIITEGGRDVLLMVERAIGRLILTRTGKGKIALIFLYPEANIMGPFYEEEVLAREEGLRDKIKEMLEEVPEPAT